MDGKRQIITITGPSAAGKTTAVEELMKTGRYAHIRSFTTRPSRVGEVNGQHYDFISVREARNLIKTGAVLESAFFRSHYYGTSIEQAETCLDSGLIPIKVVEPSGVAQFRKKEKQMGFKLIAVYFKVCEGVIAERMINRAVDEFAETGKVSDMTKYRIRHAIEVEAKQWSWRATYNMTIDADGPFHQVMSNIARKFIARGIDPYLTKYLL